MDSPSSLYVTISESELEAMLQKAAVYGARKALAEVGLHDQDAATDVRELRNLLDSWRDAKQTAWKTFIGWMTKGALVLLVFGAWHQFKDK
jgi:hypothetical protein